MTTTMTDNIVHTQKIKNQEKVDDEDEDYDYNYYSTHPENQESRES